MYKLFVKRLLDIILSFLALSVLSIPMAVVAIAVKIDSPGPVFFKQKRTGIHKSDFTLIKFRSMPTSAPKNVATHQLEVGKVQLSSFQQTIRRLSIDELPQLVNIFLGHMSIVGPRPCLPTQYDLIEERDKYGANDIKPGLTGLAQISGRDELEINVKAQFDGEYTRAFQSNHGFKMDVKCFLKSIVSVLKSDGVVESGTGAIKKEAEKQETVTK